MKEPLECLATIIKNNHFKIDLYDLVDKVLVNMVQSYSSSI